MKREDAALLLWALYRILCVVFMNMFLLGLTIGIFQVIGLNPPLSQYMNFLMIGGVGGMVLMMRVKEGAKKLLEISGA